MHLPNFLIFHSPITHQHSNQYFPTMPKSRSVAVIGGGVSGLSAARELLREGHRVVVFERSARIGGTWVYNPNTDSDPSGLDPTRQIVHGSLYRSLRTNLPRKLMGFSEYPFPDEEGSFGDGRVFPGHSEVLAFIEEFAREGGVVEVVRIGAEVVRVERKEEWVVEWRREVSEELEIEVFEAVVVCNGHHTVPRFADVPGIEKWPGKQIHSHNYRIPEPFQNQVVVIIGRGASAFDISKEISELAKEVHVASRSADFESGKLEGYDNIWQHLMIKCVYEDGSVAFEDGSTVVADVILHCTGYSCSFPFLKGDEVVSIDDNRVGPLYKHVFPPHLAPWISFVGLTSKSIIFLMIELQSKWVAKVLSGKLKLPSEEDMLLSVKEQYMKMEETQRPKHHTHYLTPHEPDYLNWLAAEIGLPPVEEWKVKMYGLVMKCVMSHDGGYRDRWDAEFWMAASLSCS